MKRRASLRRKVTLTLLGAIGSALALLAVGFAIYEYRGSEARLRANLDLVAEMVFVSVAGSVDFLYADTAAETLAKYQSGDLIKAAALYRDERDGPMQLFASHVQPGHTPVFPPEVRGDGFYVAGDAALIVKTFRRSDGGLATLQIESNLTAVRRGFRDSLRVLAIVFLLLLGVAVGLSRILQDAITRPILRLAATAQAITETQDYSLRTEVSTRDEIGQLGARINEMLERIAERDRTIVRANAFQTAILESTGVAVISTGLDGRILSFNRAAEQMLGYTREEVVGRSTPLIWHSEEQIAERARTLAAELGRPTATDFEVLVARVRRGQPESCAWRWRRKDGSELTVQLVISAMCEPGGAVTGFCGLATDVSEQRQTEESLQASERRYRIVVDQTGQMVYDLDVRTGVNRWFGASAVRHITGYELEEFQGISFERWAELIHPEDRAIALENFNNSAAEGLPYDALYRFRHRDGSYRVIQDLGVFLRNEAGEVVQMLGVMSDVTQRLEAAEAIRRLNVELEERVRLRTGELNQRVAEVEQLNAELRSLMQSLASSQQHADRSAARLQEVNSSLLIANQELEAFSYSVSHDLRAPLRNITGFLELLERRTASQLDSESQRFVTVVIAEARRMGMLIDDLLTFSRIGRAEMSLQEVHLEEVVTDVRQELSADLADRRIHWTVHPLPAILADRVLLRQVVANLLENAVKFTRRRDPALIEVGVGARRPADRFATFFVRDNGAGFNPKYLDKLFGVFQRLHNARDFEGTGIGLANVKRIVSRHGGRVWAEGAVDHGATFYFTLPVAPSTDGTGSARS
jgi:PAS domain S-box-containing protein